MQFNNRVALVTGGSSGIGLAVARLLAAEGADVWLLARDEAKLRNAQVQVENACLSPRQRCATISVDVADAAAAAAAVRHVIDCAGVPDLVINSAGAAHPGYFQDLDLDVFRSMMDVNYFGTVHVTKVVVPHMIKRRSGYIVNVSSLAGLLGIYGYTAYGASKYAVRGFSDALRAEMRQYGIRVSIVFPPDTDTPQLAYENQYKPAETKQLAGNATVMSAEAVAAEILRGIRRGRYIILPGFEGKLFYWLSGLVGSALYPIMDLMVARARRKTSGTSS